MRRAVVLLAALCALGAAFLLAANIRLGGRAAAFTLEDTESSGSASAAEGLTLSFSASLGGQLYWGAQYSPSDGAFGTEFAYGREIDFAEDNSGGPSYAAEFGAGAFFNGSAADEVEEALFRDLAERADALGRYGEYSETIYLADYYDFYPVDAYSVPTDEREGFAEFFRVPVLPGDSLDISVSGGQPGGYFSSRGMSSNDHTEFLSLRGVSAGGAVYFAFSSGLSPLSDFDFSLIPGGFGIYRLPRDLNTGLPVSAGLKCILPLDPAEILSIDLHATPDGELLLAAVRDLSGAVELYVLDAASPGEAGVIPLFDAADSYLSIYFYPDFLVYSYDSELLVLEYSGGGVRPALRVPDPLAQDFDWVYSNTGTSFAWDGERLAIALWKSPHTFSEEDGRAYRNTLEFRLFALDGSGTLYDSHLSTDLYANNHGLPGVDDISNAACSLAFKEGDT